MGWLLPGTMEADLDGEGIDDLRGHRQLDVVITSLVQAPVVWLVA